MTTHREYQVQIIKEAAKQNRGRSGMSNKLDLPYIHLILMYLFSAIAGNMYIGVMIYLLVIELGCRRI